MCESFGTMYSEYHHGSIRQQLAYTNVLVYLERETDRQTDALACVSACHKDQVKIYRCVRVYIYSCLCDSKRMHTPFSFFFFLKSVVLV